MKRLVLIDGHAILHRAYHAFPKTLTTRSGELVNAVYGFARMLLKVIEDLRPSHIAVTFDLPKPTFRHDEFIGYQAQRPKMDEALSGQIKRVFQVVESLEIPIFTAEGFEADDVIGTLALQAVPIKRKAKSEKRKTTTKKFKLEVVIVTGDKDIMQLVRDGVKVYAPIKGFSQAKLFGSKEVKKLLGVAPAQIVDYKALVGDPSDNYPGVPGVGPKTAVSLLKKYETFERIYKDIKKVENEKLREKLQKGRHSAELSRKLAQIVTNAPVRLKLKACRVHEYDQAKAKTLFEELEFKSLVFKLPGVKKSPSPKPQNKQMSLL